MFDPKGKDNESTGSRELDQIRELNSQYDKGDAARDTGSSQSEVDQAWSDAAAEGDDG